MKFESEGKKEQDANEYQGFDLYPERRSDKTKESFYERLLLKNKRKLHQTIVCEKNVLQSIKQNPLIKLLFGALKHAGCPVNIKRHIVCESCNSVVTGGYDQEMNQIVVCENIFKGRNKPDATLVHELIHMYDYCVGKIDFRNLEHLACTEIRAANLAHCSFLSSMILGQSSPFNVKKTHQYCVKMKAAQSMIISRNISLDTAMTVILKVFDKCYNDLEPFGRRIRRNSADPILAYNEGIRLGICDP